MDPETLVRRWFGDLFTQGELHVADLILADDVRYHGPSSLSPPDVTGPDDIKEYVEVYRTAFPDLLYEVESVSVADGETRVRWTATGTHEDDLFGVESTGEMFTVEGIGLFDIEDGEIQEVHAQWDTLKMLQELELVSQLGLDLG